MNNQQVLTAFELGKSGHSLNMSTDGVKLWSYNTVVAQWINVNGRYTVVKNATKYSRTTSKQISGLQFFEVTKNKNIPFNTQDLSDYI